MGDDTGVKPSTVTAVTADDGGADHGDAAPSSRAKAVSDPIRDAFIAGDFEAEIADDIATRAKAKAAPKNAKAAPPKDDDEDLEDKVEAANDDEDVDLDDEDDDDLEDAEAELEADEDADEKAAAKEDPDLAKRMAAVQKREKRLVEQAAERDRAFTRERDSFVTEWKPRVEKAVAIEKRFEEMKRDRDLLGILKLIDFPEDAYEEASQELWGLSKAGRADPKYRDVATRLQEKRSLRAEASEAKALAKKLEERLNDRDAQTEARAHAEAFMGRVSKAIGDTTPLLKKRLELQPQSTQARLARIAMKLVQKAGAEVDPKLVARTYEKRLRAERELAKQLGDDEATETTAPAKKSAIKVVDKTKKDATTVVETKKPTNGSNGVKFLSREEMVENLRKIQRGELDPDAD